MMIVVIVVKATLVMCANNDVGGYTKVALMIKIILSMVNLKFVIVNLKVIIVMVKMVNVMKMIMVVIDNYFIQTSKIHYTKQDTLMHFQKQELVMLSSI